MLSTCRFLNPVGMFMGMAVVAGVFVGSVWAGENKVVIKNFKRQNPAAFVVAVMVVSYMLMSLVGGVIVFMSGITFPLASKLPVVPGHTHNALFWLCIVHFYFCRMFNVQMCILSLYFCI